MIFCRRALALILFLAPVAGYGAEQQQNSGTFVLHKFAKAIGKESYTIEAGGDRTTLHSHFLFTDRGRAVPLETTFVTTGRGPQSYVAKGRSSRISEMDDQLAVSGDEISITRRGRTESHRLEGAWFIVDGYSPVAMQEQMIRWWLTHGSPTEFTAYPAQSRVHIEAADRLTVGGRKLRGYTVGGLIWGEESLWIDDSANLVALVSTDAEFDHFEAIREAEEANLGTFIATAVRAEVAALERLTGTAALKRAPLLAITGATLEDSTGAPPVKDGVILIANGVIRAAGPRGRFPIPRNATVLDASGKYAIPGLWDMHAHYEQVEWGPIYLATGVTSVRDVGNEFDFIRTIHEILDRKVDPAIGPHLEFAGVIDGTGPESIGAVTADTPEQAAALVERYRSAGARQIKIYSSMKPEIVKAIAADAHARGMTVTGHIPDGMTAIEGIHDGMDQINHIQYLIPYFSHPATGADGKPDPSAKPFFELEGPGARDLLSTMEAHHTVLDDTSALFEVFLHTKPLDQVEPGIDHIDPQLRNALEGPLPAGKEAAQFAERWQNILAILKTVHAAGIQVVAGTDQAVPGYSLHRELEIYVEAGFTPEQALQAATIEAARALGVEKESGSFGAGKRGDVVLLNADPLVDIHNTRAVWRTVAAGAVYDPAPLLRSIGFTP